MLAATERFVAGSLLISPNLPPVSTVPPPSPPSATATTEIACDILVVGAGLGGTAAAIQSARLGRRVCLIEETAWPGGQISTQGVPAFDENQYIETFGGTGSYYELRNGIRAYYRDKYTLAPSVRDDPRLNPGNAWVSLLSFEPPAGVAVLEQMMAGPHDSGDLQVFYRTIAVAAEVYTGEVRSVLTRHLENGTAIRFRPGFVLDATDLGNLFVFTATSYAVGEESRSQTGEPSAPLQANPTCVQDFTFPFAVEYCPGEVHTIPKPDGYELNKLNQPYTLAYTNDRPPYRVFETAPGTHGSFWAYRRALDAKNFDDPRITNDVSIINWTANDYRGGTVLDRLPAEQAALYTEARLLSLGFLYWLQTEVPRDDGGIGYPEFKPRPDIMGSADGLSQVAYVREGRRLRAAYTIIEQDISTASQPGPRAKRYDDSVGIGFYPIDLHGCGTLMLGVPTHPFQIPLGALVPQRTVNLLPAAKNIGTTHLTNGAYRVHPVEWAVGNAAAVLAVFCLLSGTTPHQVYQRPDLVRRVQILLLDNQVPLYWYDDVPLAHPAFTATQLLAVDGVWEGTQDNLHFDPDGMLTISEGKTIVAALARRIQHWRGSGAANPTAGVLRPAPEDAVLPLRWEAVITMVTIAIPDSTAPAGATEKLGQQITRADLAMWLGMLLRQAIEENRIQPSTTS
jgi:FAD dependent oxidoreductase